MVLVQNRPIFNPFSAENLGHENVFYDILNWKKKKKKPFYAIKARRWKRRKTEIFPKGLVHGFGT